MSVMRVDALAALRRHAALAVEVASDGQFVGVCLVLAVVVELIEAARRARGRS